ncbi:purine-nucleoside phosphorylase [candidate division WOR-3 bacterium]|nr:purine-nucleoside phosphorylase [candidate division WOR-3 bacterium]TET79481.1 MAG: purine-nucleoside phosphorylase [Candidatus Cloacimonadota bacterium]
MPIHLRANKGDYASTVLLVGDPGRTERISQILKNSKPVNKNRGLLGYTGTYKDKKISVQTTAMGCPSAAIVVEELIQLDVKRFIRIGTCGGIGEHIKPLDIIAAIAASPFDGTTRTYLNNEPHAPYATFEILKTAYDVAQDMGIKVYFSGIASVDVFYNPSADYVQKLREKGIVAVEMETSLIYYLANRSKKQAASFLLVSDIVGGGEKFTKFVTDEALAKAMDQLIHYVLETAILFD